MEKAGLKLKRHQLVELDNDALLARLAEPNKNVADAGRLQFPTLV